MCHRRARTEARSGGWRGAAAAGLLGMAVVWHVFGGHILSARRGMGPSRASLMQFDRVAVLAPDWRRLTGRAAPPPPAERPGGRPARYL